MNGNVVKSKPEPAQGRRKYRRLRTLQRMGLLAPLIKLQRKIDGR